MIRTLLAGLALVASLSFAPRARAEGGLTITKQQYQLYKDYQGALDDERVKKMKEKDRLPAIARNFKVKEKELREAVELGEKEGAQIEQVEGAALKEAFKGTPLEGHTSDLHVDASKGHIVAYVQWFNSEPTKADQEACYAAARAIKAAPLAGTVVLQADLPGQKDHKVYSSLISAENAGRIKEDQIVDFAQTRYVRLFEKRENVAAQP